MISPMAQMKAIFILGLIMCFSRMSDFLLLSLTLQIPTGIFLPSNEIRYNVPFFYLIRIFHVIQGVSEKSLMIFISSYELMFFYLKLDKGLEILEIK